MKVKVKKVAPGAVLPVRGSAEAAGYDIAVLVDGGSEVIMPGETKKLQTGLAFEIPEGYYMRIEGRSSLADMGLMVIPGIVDSDFRGGVTVVVRNMSDDWTTVYNQERLAQAIIQKHETIDWTESDTLSETVRGTGGFGSTG